MISLPRLKRALGFAAPDVAHADDQYLTDTLARALAFVEEQTQRYFGAIDPAGEEYATGLGTRNLWLVGLPNESDEYHALTVTEQEYPGAAQTELEEYTDFELRGSHRQKYLVRRGAGYVWTRGYEYLVVYTRGYAEDGLPGDIEALLIDLVGLRYSTLGSDGLKGETIGGYSYTTAAYTGSDLDAITGGQDTIDAWKPPVLA